MYLSASRGCYSWWGFKLQCCLCVVDPTLEAVYADINVKAVDVAKESAESDDSYNDWEELTYFEPVKTADWWTAEKVKFVAERKQIDEKFDAKYVQH